MMGTPIIETFQVDKAARFRILGVLALSLATYAAVAVAVVYFGLLSLPALSQLATAAPFTSTIVACLLLVFLVLWSLGWLMQAFAEGLGRGTSRLSAEWSGSAF